MKNLFTNARWVLGAMTLIVYASIQAAGGIDAAGELLLKALAACAFSWVLLVIVEVCYHAIKGKGQACPYCGELRQMASFRVYQSCPKCGK